MAVDKKPHLMVSFLPQIQLLVAHRLGTIRGDPDLALVSAGHAWLLLFGYWNQPDERLTIAGDHDVLTGKRAFDEARKRALCLVHVYDFGHRDACLANLAKIVFRINRSSSRIDRLPGWPKDGHRSAKGRHSARPCAQRWTQGRAGRSFCRWSDRSRLMRRSRRRHADASIRNPNIRCGRCFSATAIASFIPLHFAG